MTHDLRPLIDAYCHGSATDEQLESLAALLRDDAGARRAFAESLDLHAALRWRETSGARIATIDATPASTPARAASAGRTHPLRIAPLVYSIAAALLLAAAAFAIYLFAASRPPSPVPSDATPVATLIESTGTVVVGDDIANPGDAYAAGEYTLESGSASFLLTNRVGMHLRGDTHVVLHGSTRASLMSGSVSFECPPGAEGFTVECPDGSRVVDLGTAFTVCLVGEAGTPVVTVTEGRVRVFSADPAIAPVTLSAEQGAAIEPGGRIVDHAAPAVITMTPDRSATSPPGYGSDVARLVDDPFAYNPNSPLDPRPRQTWQDDTGPFGFVSLGGDSESIALDFDRPCSAIVLDLYGRTDYEGFEHSRSKNLTFELYLGDGPTPVYTESGFNGVTSKDQTPASYGRWTAPPHVVADRLRISHDGDRLLLMEIRGTGVRYAPARDVPNTNLGSDTASEPTESEKGLQAPSNPQ